jgi:hypothetical protein
MADDLDNEAAADVLGIAAQTLAAWRMQGKGPEFYKTGGRVRYRRQVLELFRAQHCPSCFALLPAASTTPPPKVEIKGPTAPLARPLMHLKLKA